MTARYKNTLIVVGLMARIKGCFDQLSITVTNKTDISRSIEALDFQTSLESSKHASVNLHKTNKTC